MSRFHYGVVGCVLWVGVAAIMLSACEDIAFDAPATFAAIERPMGVAVLPDGRIAATDTKNDTVNVFAADGTRRATWAATHAVTDTVRAPGFLRPLKLAANATTLYVTDYIADRIVRLDLDTGRVHGSWGTTGSAPGALSSPAGIAVGPTGNIWTTEFYNHRVQVFSPEGAFLFGFGRHGKTDGEFNYPTGITVRKDAVFVADAYNHRVQKLSLAGTPIDAWGSPFQLPWPFAWKGFFNVASGVAVTAKCLFASDEFHDTVQAACHFGRRRGLAAAGALKHPTDVAVAADGTLYVADFGNDRVATLPWRVE